MNGFEPGGPEGPTSYPAAENFAVRPPIHPARGVPGVAHEQRAEGISSMGGGIYNNCSPPQEFSKFFGSVAHYFRIPSVLVGRTWIKIPKPTHTTWRVFAAT